VQYDCSLPAIFIKAAAAASYCQIHFVPILVQPAIVDIKFVRNDEKPFDWYGKEENYAIWSLLTGYAHQFSSF